MKEEVLCEGQNFNDQHASKNSRFQSNMDKQLKTVWMTLPVRKTCALPSRTEAQTEVTDCIV